MWPVRASILGSVPSENGFIILTAAAAAAKEPQQSHLSRSTEGKSVHQRRKTLFMNCEETLKAPDVELVLVPVP